MTAPDSSALLSRMRALPWHRVAGVGAGVAVVVVLLLGLLVRLRVIQEEIDAEWMAEVLELRSPFWEVPSRALDFLGGGWFAIVAVPLGIAAVFLLRRRPRAALVFVGASAMSAVIVQALKVLFSRARPDDILLDLHSGAYPSGHVTNAATVVVVLALLVGRAWVLIPGLGYVVLMALSRTYLGAHWVTDTLGGALLGAAVGVGAWAIFGPILHSERMQRRASVGP
jgi:undecaprenyl-diphosphatase